MAFRYLDDATLEAVRKAAIDLGFATDENLTALTADLPPAFVAATMPGAGNAVARLLGFTSRLNTTRALVTGEVPLHVWLKTAIFLAAERQEELVLRRALELASPDGAASPPGVAPSSVPAPSPDLDALPRVDGGLEVTIGKEDDTLGVDFLHAGAAASRSVAKLLVHRHFDGVPSIMAGNRPDRVSGTGWTIAPGLLITNHHVIKAREGLEPPASQQDFELQGAAVEVQFDYFGPDPTPLSTRSTGCVASDPVLDYALLRLAADAPARPPLPLRTSAILKPADRALQERVNVLQHPDGHPMRLGFRNNFVVAGTDELLSYLTDTKGGSSGSPLCDDAWFVAGLHHGWGTIPGGPLKVWDQLISQENRGTPIPRIMRHLEQEHPALHAEIVAGQPV